MALERTGRLERLLDHGPATRSLFLRPEAPLRFLPGQFLSCLLPVEGAVLTRPYSIASDPESPDVLELVVDLVPGGPGSRHLLSLRPGVETSTIPPTEEPSQGSQPATGNKELIVLDWSGYDLPEFRQPFNEKHPGLEPSYNYFADDAEAFAKVQSGFEFDVVHPCSNFWQFYVDHGLVQPIDTSRLSNWDKLYPSLAKQGEINDKQYFVPYEWGYDSILVRTDKVKDIPDSWADLWDPQYAGHLALYDSGEVNHVTTALALGFDPWNTTPEQDEQITQKLLEIKPNVLTFWSDYAEVTQLMASGDIWVAANTWNEAYTTLLDEGVQVE